MNAAIISAAVDTVRRRRARIMKCSSQDVCRDGCPHGDVHLSHESCQNSCRGHTCQQVKLRGKALGGRLAG